MNLREATQQALEALNVYASKAEHKRTHADDCAAEEAITTLRAALAQHRKRVPTHRIKSWGFCGVCRHDRIPGEGCARQECPDSPQQAEPVLQTCNFRWDGEVQVQQCTRAHGIGEEK